jgi:hypothetical protein
MSDSTGPPDDNFDLILGAFLKCAKGHWTFKGLEIPIGPNGVKPLLLMSTARHGFVEFVKDGDVTRPIVTGLRRYSECDPPRGKAPDGKTPYTIVQGIIEEQLATFAAASYGAQKSFKELVDTWRVLYPDGLPIVSLGTRPSGDVNDNVAPTFTPVKWVSADKSSWLPALSGEVGSPAVAAPIAPIEAAPALKPKPLIVVTTGKVEAGEPAIGFAPKAEAVPNEMPPPIAEDDDNLRREIDDDIPF